MRAATIVLLLSLASVPALAADDVRGFDHQAHERALKAKGKRAPECNDCHRASAAGKLPLPGKNHEPCKNSGCHSPWPLKPSRTEYETLCLSCHRESAFARGNVGVFYPPYGLGSEYVTGFSHRTHTQQAASGKMCERCHTAFGPEAARASGPVSKGHDACSGCHERGAEPKMTTCNGCHKGKGSEAGERAQAAKRPWDAFRVKYGFSHQTHATRVSGEEGRRCTTCHDNVGQAADGQPVPFPKMEGCADRCHDGQKAFNALGTTCTRCHVAAPAGAAGGDR